MTLEPEAYVRRAFARAGIPLTALHVAAYSPADFGNFVAEAETGIGQLKILYDRGFFVDIVSSDTQSDENPHKAGVSALLTALEDEKRVSGA